MLVELPELQPDVVDHSLDVGAPLVERAGRLFQRGHPGVVRAAEIHELALPLRVALLKTGVDF